MIFDGGARRGTEETAPILVKSRGRLREEGPAGTTRAGKGAGGAEERLYAAAERGAPVAVALADVRGDGGRLDDDDDDDAAAFRHRWMKPRGRRLLAAAALTLAMICVACAAVFVAVLGPAREAGRGVDSILDGTSRPVSGGADVSFSPTVGPSEEHTRPTPGGDEAAPAATAASEGETRASPGSETTSRRERGKATASKRKTDDVAGSGAGREYQRGGVAGASHGALSSRPRGRKRAGSAGKGGEHGAKVTSDRRGKTSRAEEEAEVEALEKAMDIDVASMLGFDSAEPSAKKGRSARRRGAKKLEPAPEEPADEDLWSAGDFEDVARETESFVRLPASEPKVSPDGRDGRRRGTRVERRAT